MIVKYTNSKYKDNDKDNELFEASKRGSESTYKGVKEHPAIKTT